MKPTVIKLGHSQNLRLVETGNNVQVVFEAVDSLLDRTDIKKSHMSILYTEGGLSFCLLNKEQNKYILIGHYKIDHYSKQKQLFEFLDRFQEMPENVSLSILDNTYTIVPHSLFNKDNLEDYLKFSVNSTKGKPQYKVIDDLVLVYEDPSSQFEWLIPRIPHIKFINNAEVALQYYLSKRLMGQNYFSVHVFNQYLETTLISDGKFELHNTFIFEKPEDFVYYLLSVYEQLKLDPLEVPIYLSGSIGKKSKEAVLLKQYIRNIEWEERPPAYLYSYTFGSQEDHFNNRLFQQHLCAL